MNVVLSTPNFPSDFAAALDVLGFPRNSILGCVVKFCSQKDVVSLASAFEPGKSVKFGYRCPRGQSETCLHQSTSESP